MAVNFSTIQTRVKSRLIDLPTNTVSEIPDFVNRAMMYLQRRHNFVVMERTATLVTTVNVRALSDLPADFKELRKGDSWYVDLNGDPVKVFVWPTLEMVLGRFSYDDPTETGAPQVLLAVPVDNGGSDQWGGPTVQMQVWPYPDGQSQFGTGSVTSLKSPTGATVSVPSGEYPIFIPYWGFVQPLVQSGDTNWFTDNAEDYLVFQAAAEGFFMNWDEARGKFWEQRAEEKARDVIRLDKARRMGRTNQLQVFRDAYGPRGRWYNGFVQVPGE